MGIGTTTEPGNGNSIGKNLMTSGQFNLGEDVRWTSFVKTFDVAGRVGSLFCVVVSLLCFVSNQNDGCPRHPTLWSSPGKNRSNDYCMGFSDKSVVGSSDLTWVVSNKDLANVSSLAIGQEVRSGGYQNRYILTGPPQYENPQVLNNSDIVHFDTMSQVQTSGPGIYEGCMMLHSAGAAASGVTRWVESLSAEGANLTATPYCETVITRSLFMADPSWMLRPAVRVHATAGHPYWSVLLACTGAVLKRHYLLQGCVPASPK